MPDYGRDVLPRLKPNKQNRSLLTPITLQLPAPSSLLPKGYDPLLFDFTRCKSLCLFLGFDLLYGLSHCQSA
jgi:hypothetical protein